MLVAPGRERIVDVDELLGEAIEIEPALGVPIDLKPGTGDRLDRTVAEIEPCPLERASRSSFLGSRE